jgi:nitrile hydratase beta subunit
MDGIHDVGGEQGFGRVKPTADEPPFAHEWEGRMLGIVRAISRPPDWNVDKFRFTREQLPPVEYLTRPYFDQWYRSYAAMLVASGLVTAEELASGRSTHTVTGHRAPMTATDVASLRKMAAKFDRPYAGQPLFAVGDHVRASLSAHPGHTRLPRYVRGHVGVIVALHGAHIVPDENAQGRSIAEPLYTIAFALHELFPEQTGSGDKVHLDLWERYLEPIEPT